MKPKRRWNERTRLILTLELAVVLPAAALVILSAWHLKQIQRDRAVEAAIQRDFSQMLAISEKEIDHKAYDQLDDIRSGFPAPGITCAETLDRLLTAHPYAAHLFAYDERFPTTRTVDAHIVRLRQKVEPKPEEPRFILTVHGTGYKFVG